MPRWFRRQPWATLAFGLAGCAPLSSAEHAQAGRLWEACSVGLREHSEQTQGIRAALRERSGLRMDLELLSPADAATLVGGPLLEDRRVLRYRFREDQTPVLTSIEIVELRLGKVRYRPRQISEREAVDMVLGPDGRPAPGGLLGEKALVVTLIPLCLLLRGPGCDPSELELPAHEEERRREGERQEQLEAVDTLRQAKEHLLELFGEPAEARKRPPPQERYLLLHDDGRPGRDGPARITFVARHLIKGGHLPCSMEDRFSLELASEAALNHRLSGGASLAELPLQEIPVWTAKTARGLP